MTKNKALQKIRDAVNASESIRKEYSKWGNVQRMIDCDTIQTALAALKALCEEGWQPIETCPKIYGCEYMLTDERTGQEIVTWFGQGEWFLEIDPTHWKPFETKADRIAQEFMEEE